MALQMSLTVMDIVVTAMAMVMAALLKQRIKIKLFTFFKNIVF